MERCAVNTFHWFAWLSRKYCCVCSIQVVNELFPFCQAFLDPEERSVCVLAVAFTLYSACILGTDRLFGLRSQMVICLDGLDPCSVLAPLFIAAKILVKGFACGERPGWGVILWFLKVSCSFVPSFPLWVVLCPLLPVSWFRLHIVAWIFRYRI